ncbi:MAG: nucleoside kinase [Dictyoglomus sp. NZ13-RE01]|nr:MAG: nucleoside kinase [Dictyoglomus sp. NZ13-RE01]
MINIEIRGAIKIQEENPIQAKDLLTKYKELFNELLNGDHPVAIRVNGKIEDLNYLIQEDVRLDFLGVRNNFGRRVLERSYIFLLNLACELDFPEHKVIVEHSYHKSLYGRFKNYVPKTKDLEIIENKMRELAEKDIPIEKIEVSREEALKIFEERKEDDKIRLLKYIPFSKIQLYKIDNHYEYSYLPLVPSTGYLKVFSLKLYQPGFILILPEEDLSRLSEFKEIVKLFQAFYEYKNWLEILGLVDTASLNESIEKGEISDVIKVAEALHEKKIAQIADEICSKLPDLKLVLIAGPSSAGKTTFSKRLQIQLKVNGIKPIVIEMDDYFLPPEYIERDEFGNYDFDSPKALDIPLLNRDLNILMNGGEVELPKYNFHKKRREKSGRIVKLEDRSIIVMEGIHGLNPEITRDVPGYMKYHIFVSALTHLNLDNQNRVPTTDARLMRRIVRDSIFRGYGVLDSIRQWPSVRKAEDLYIFPTQERADVMFNSALVYEFSVLRNFAEPMLKAVPPYYPEYPEAKRILDILSHFLPLSPTEVPMTSILREFIGGSSFTY